MPSGLVAETVLLRLGRQCVEHTSAPNLIALSVREHIRCEKTTVCADAAIWERLFLQQFHEMRPRDIQQVGRLLRRQLRVHGKERYRVAIRHLAQYFEEELESATWHDDILLRIRFRGAYS
jgi:iron-sulfur cluster repair protein YtfE (RIC family)